jgi:DNA polymerase III subunit epsilon
LPCSCSGHYSTGRAAYTEISDIICAADPDISPSSPLYNECICFTGELTFATRAEAALKAAHRDAIPQDSVTSRTRYLVVGISDFINAETGLKSSKLQKAEALIEKGQCLEIISEDEFVDLLCQ